MCVPSLGSGEWSTSIVHAEQAACACAAEEKTRNGLFERTRAIQAHVYAARQETAGRGSADYGREMATLTQKMRNGASLTFPFLKE